MIPSHPRSTTAATAPREKRGAPSLPNIYQNFIIDEKVRGPISIIAPTAFPIEEAIKVLGSILEMRGYTLVPSGDFIKVKPIDKDIITRIIQLEYAEASAIRQGTSTKRDVRSRHTSMIASPDNRSLILTGASSDIQQLGKIIKALDKPSEATNNIGGLLLRYSKLTGKNIIIGKIGQRRATGFNPNGLSDEDLLNSMETIISTAGLKMEDQGDIIVIKLDPDKVEVMDDPPDKNNQPGIPPKPRHSKRNS